MLPWQFIDVLLKWSSTSLLGAAELGAKGLNVHVEEGSINLPSDRWCYHGDMSFAQDSKYEAWLVLLGTGETTARV